MHRKIIEDIKKMVNDIELSKILDSLNDAIEKIIKMNMDLMESDIIARSLVISMIISNGGEFILKENPSKYMRSTFIVSKDKDEHGNMVLKIVEPKHN
jgi:hypothetical protein